MWKSVIKSLISIRLKVGGAGGGGVMGQNTGQSYGSKSRSVEYFVNKRYLCYWQYQFMLGVGEKRKSGRNEK